MVMLPFLTGLREWCAQRDERDAHTRIPAIANMTSGYVSPQKIVSSAPMDEYSDEDEEFQITEEEEEVWLTSCPCTISTSTM
jgi:DNA-binding transcriptional regulator YdaS (Cro superfamily)